MRTTSVMGIQKDQPAIFHVTHWKAGSQWIYKILREIASERIVVPQLHEEQFLERPVVSGAVYPCLYVTKEKFQSIALPENHRKFIIIRDLRDTLISGYFSIRYSHIIIDESLAQWRKHLETMSIEEGLLMLMDEWLPMSARIQQSWIEAGEKIIRYEDLLKNDTEILEELLIKYCEIPVTPQKLHKVVMANRFENLTGGRKSGEENIMAHERKGIDGDWKNYFTPLVIEKFNEKYGSLLINAGYELTDLRSMTFISYAQNFEDIMLWRALKHIEKGLYVDIGAQDPVNDSVSNAFYQRGWRGVHVEPVPEYAALLRRHRPDETVLEVALAETEGVIDFYVAPDTGLSTAVAACVPSMEERHQIQVKTLTMESAFAFLAGRDVHWLKIDVEGFEEKVLKGWNSQILRPWILIIEATAPNSAEENYMGWEPIVIAANYQFVYFDGLNRFYVAKEHTELVPAFSRPPNCFDDFEFYQNSLYCKTLLASLQKLQADCAARGEQIKTLTEMLKESEIDRAARGEQIETLTGMLKESEADRAARGEQIEALTGMLKESEADRPARGEQIETLTEMLKESEADRAARWTQIEALTAMVHESEANRAAQSEQIEKLTLMLRESNVDQTIFLADLQALFARPSFRALIRLSNWPEVNKIINWIQKPNE